MASHSCAWYSPPSSQALHKVYNEPENMVWSWVCDPSAQEAEAGGSCVQVQFGLFEESLCQASKQTNKVGGWACSSANRTLAWQAQRPKLDPLICVRKAGHCS